MNHSRNGEIATTVTLVTLFLMVIGAIAGQVSVQNSKILRNKAAEGCTYNTDTIVLKRIFENGQIKQRPLTQTDNGRQLYVINDKGQRGNLDAISALFSQRLPNYTFSPYPTPPPIPRASVTLYGLDTSKWTVKEQFCNPLTGPAPGKGCPFNGVRSSSDVTIRDFSVDCGNNLSYGWIVEPKEQTAPTAVPRDPESTAVPTSSQSCVREGGRCGGFQACCSGSICVSDTLPPIKPPPLSVTPITPNGGTNRIYGICVRTNQPPTPKPTAPTASNCSYTAYAQVRKLNSSGGLSLLTLAENGSNAGFGVSNNKQIEQFGTNYVAGKFGTIQRESKTSTLGSSAEFDYINPRQPYKDFFPSDPHLYSIGENASVTLFGLNPRFKIKGKFCDDLGSGPASCDRGIKSQPLDKKITDFKLYCGTYVRYGWIVEDTVPTSSPKPTKPIYPTINLTMTVTPSPTVTPSVTPTPIVSQTPTPQPIACNGAATAGGYSEFPDEREWEMGTETGNVYISYDMYNIPDKLELFQNQTDIYHTGGSSGSSGFVSNQLVNKQVNYLAGDSTKIKAVLTSNRNDTGTAWVYSISCPMEPPPTEAICNNTTGSVSGKIDIPNDLKSLCDSLGGCKIKVDLLYDNHSSLSTIAEGPDYEFFFTPASSKPVYVEEKVRVSITQITAADGRSFFSSDIVAKNCFAPRSWGTPSTVCVLDMTREKSCNAENVDFMFFSYVDTSTSHFTKISRFEMDMNKDGVINSIDFARVVRVFGKVAKNATEDLNHDGFVNSLDISLIIYNLNKPTG